MYPELYELNTCQLIKEDVLLDKVIVQIISNFHSGLSSDQFHPSLSDSGSKIN